MKEGPLLKLQKPKGSMQGSGGRDIVYQWKARTVNTDMERLEVKAQLTQQRKPTWLVEYNCPTHRSWQSNKAVLRYLIEDKMKEKEMTHKEIQRKTTSDKTMGKKKLTWWRN